VIKRIHLIALGILTSLCCGCGNHARHLTGIVSMQGKPLSSGAVTFIPRRIGVQPIVVPIEADGSFVINLNRSGITPGNYDVTVSSWEAPALPSENGDGHTPLGISLIPVRYSDLKTSGLKCTVWSFGANRLTINLTE
jgi:hypothetical protein